MFKPIYYKLTFFLDILADNCKVIFCVFFPTFQTFFGLYENQLCTDLKPVILTVNIMSESVFVKVVESLLFSYAVQ